MEHLKNEFVFIDWKRPTVDTFYKIVGENRIHTITFEKYILEEKFANNIFSDLEQCADIDSCYLIDATTGEIIRYFEK